MKENDIITVGTIELINMRAQLQAMESRLVELNKSLTIYDNEEFRKLEIVLEDLKAALITYTLYRIKDIFLFSECTAL